MSRLWPTITEPVVSVDEVSPPLQLIEADYDSDYSERDQRLSLEAFCPHSHMSCHCIVHALS